MALPATIQAVALLATCVLASSYPPIPSDTTTPVQQRLSIIGPDSMSVAWNTYSKPKESCIEYGTLRDSLSLKTCSQVSTTYSTSRTYFNAVTLKGLQPATTYYYKIVSGNSSLEHFTSPRPAGDTTPFNMNVVVDMGVYGEDGFTTKKREEIPFVPPEMNHSTIGALARSVNEYDFVIHPGDFAYADDWALKSTGLAGKDAFEAIMENFYNQLAPVAGRKPYMASPGNHEAACIEVPVVIDECPDGQKNFTDFLNRFGRTMPATFASTSNDNRAKTNAQIAQSLAVPPFWYSFEYGMAHVTMINTETDFPNAPDASGGSASWLNSGPFGASGQQLKFLEADLASVDRTKTPWLIVAGHRPWYSTGPEEDRCTSCQSAFESLFYKYGVDVGVFGHVHNSQRFLPVVNNTADPAGLNNPKAPAYIIAGGAGNIEGLDPAGNNYSTNVFAYDKDFSYATLKFKDANHLGIDFIRSSTGEVVDSSVLQKAHETAFVVQS